MKKQGLILSLTGGLYTVQCDDKKVLCRAKGSFRKDGIHPMPGDLVTIASEETTSPAPDGHEAVICEIATRKNHLIRPMLANIDTVFLTVAVQKPAPNFFLIDQFLSILNFHQIQPVLIFTKKELDPARAFTLCEKYRAAGFEAEAVTMHDPQEARGLIYPHMTGTISALSGASGVGKSTLMQTLFSSLNLKSGSLSKKTERGKHTTRQCVLFDISSYLDANKPRYLADTPGFSLIDIKQFAFDDKDRLAETFPEFLPYLGTCKFKKCTHQTEEGCRIVEAVASGIIDPDRHQSYRQMYQTMANAKPRYLKK